MYSGVRDRASLRRIVLFYVVKLKVLILKVRDLVGVWVGYCCFMKFIS